MNDKTYTVTLSRIEWTHVLAAVTEIKHDTRRSAFVRQKYGEIGRAIREQIEQPTNDLYLNLSESVLSQYWKNEKRFFYPDRECLAICPIRETEEIEPLPTIAIGEAKEGENDSH